MRDGAAHPPMRAQITEYFELLGNCSHPGNEGIRMMEEDLSPALLRAVRSLLLAPLPLSTQGAARSSGLSLAQRFFISPASSWRSV